MNHDVANEASIPLTSGATLPKIGLGCWKLPEDVAPKIVHEAIRVGYRHIDSACDYGNEDAVGAGLARAFQDGLCQRDDVWVTSKLWNTYHAPEHVRPAVERTLLDLGLDALDLYHVHFPIAQAFVPFEQRYPPGWFFDPDAASPGIRAAKVPISDTWGAMEELVQAGLVRHIGVCNFSTCLLRDLLNYATIRPAVHQVEMHPYLTQQRLLRFCAEEQIPMTAFSPFGAVSYISLGMATENDSVLNDPVLTTIGTQHGRSPAQIALRWAVQRGTSVVPKTQSPERLVENLSVFDFELSDEQMLQIDGLDRGQRFNDPGDFCEKAFNTFFPIYD